MENITTTTFRKAIKRDAWLRLGMAGPSGGGKTFTLLKIAERLAQSAGKPGRIACVDTEHGSASKYAHTDKCFDTGQCVEPGYHFDFDTNEPEVYDPRQLTQAIIDAYRAGYVVFIADSLSHYWTGKMGELDLVDGFARQQAVRAGRNAAESNSFAAWKTVTPIHNELVDTILKIPMHVLVSLRTKTEWVIEKNEQGKNVPRRIGIQPVMRDGIEYEFDIFGDIDQDNTFVVSKTRCSKLAGQAINRPGNAMTDIIIEWLAGAPVEDVPTFPLTPVPQNPVLASATLTPPPPTNGTPQRTQTDAVDPQVIDLWKQMHDDQSNPSRINAEAVYAGLRDSFEVDFGDGGLSILKDIVKKYSKDDTFKGIVLFNPAKLCIQELYLTLKDLRAKAQTNHHQPSDIDVLTGPGSITAESQKKADPPAPAQRKRGA